MVNILCAVLLGPGYGVAAAFASSLIRNLLGLGSLMPSPAAWWGLSVRRRLLEDKKYPRHTGGEVFGTAVLEDCALTR